MVFGKNGTSLQTVQTRQTEFDARFQYSTLAELSILARFLKQALDPCPSREFDTQQEDCIS
jgi:hypothetical protein